MASEIKTLEELQAWLKSEVEKLAAEANSQYPQNDFEAAGIKLIYTKTFSEIIGKGLYRALAILIDERKEPSDGQ
jgi:hypothetical protein